MADRIKHPPFEAVDEAVLKIVDIRMSTHNLLDAILNKEPWACHWLGGDRKTGSSEMRPPAVQDALASLLRADRALADAEHSLIMYQIDYPEGEQSERTSTQSRPQKGRSRDRSPRQE